MTLPAAEGPFDALCTPVPNGPGRMRCVLPDGWRQGRGLYGGLVTAVMVRSLEAQAAQPPNVVAPEGLDRTLRSLTAELCGPLQPGEVDVVVETLRQGNSVSTCTVRLEQGGEVQAHGVGVLGKTRPTSREGVHLPIPERGDWRTLDLVPIEPPMGPDFGRFFEYRLERHFPFSGGTEPVAEGWIRPKNPGSKRDAAFLAGCIDAWWPALFSVEEGPRMMATIAFTFQPFVRFEGLDPAAPLFHRERMVAAADGYCVEFRELWGEDGRLLALNQQTMAIIK
jgi:acyl-CoA hydrolase